MQDSILDILHDFRNSWRHERGRPFIDELCFRIEANLLMLASEPDDPILKRRTMERIVDLYRVLGR